MEHNADGEVFDQAWWEERYRSAPALWSGRPNAVLVAEVAGRPPGTALDAGCGEGGDALWLAEHGWRVDAVDLSTVALARAAAEAERRGLADHVHWQQADLTSWAPAGRYDLVTTSFLHPTASERPSIFGRLGAAVAPGGLFLVLQHDPGDGDVVPRPDLPDRFATAEQLAGDLDPAEWEVLVAEARPRDTAHPEHGADVTVHDAVVVARRRA